MTKQGFGKLKRLNDAKKILFSTLKPKGDETVSLKNCVGKVLSKTITSKIDVPGFNKSAMDGFAVRSGDSFGAKQDKPLTLIIIDSITAGKTSNKEVEKGMCIEITTGSAIPKGADAVLMVEYTQKDNGKIKVYKSVTPRENVIELGSDIKKDDVLLKKGVLLNPRNIGLLSGAGYESVNVYKPLRCAYFSSGDEIVEPGKELSQSNIYDINSFSIINALLEIGVKTADLGIAKDDLDEIKQKIREGLHIADFVVLSGGSSLGAEDYMVKAVEDLGEVLVHGIAVKPGKPTLIGRVEGKLVLGLPGHPTSTLSNFYVLINPLINHVFGTQEKKAAVKKKLYRKIASTIGRYEFLAVKIDGEFAVPIMKGSSSITTLAYADGFIEISENTEVLEREQIVKVVMF